MLPPKKQRKKKGTFPPKKQSQKDAASAHNCAINYPDGDTENPNSAIYSNLSRRHCLSTQFYRIIKNMHIEYHPKALEGKKIGHTQQIKSNIKELAQITFIRSSNIHISLSPKSNA